MTQIQEDEQKAAKEAKQQIEQKVTKQTKGGSAITGWSPIPNPADDARLVRLVCATRSYEASTGSSSLPGKGRKPNSNRPRSEKRNPYSRAPTSAALASSGRLPSCRNSRTPLANNMANWLPLLC